MARRARSPPPKLDLGPTKSGDASEESKGAVAAAAAAAASSESMVDVPIASFSKEVLESEKATAYRNTCLTYMMKEGECIEE